MTKKRQLFGPLECHLMHVIGNGKLK